MLRVKRAIKFFFQKRTRGWSDEETWNLDITIAKFVLPRLKRLKQLQNGYPGDLAEEKWDEILDKMIFSFDKITNDEEIVMEQPQAERVQEGLDLFANRFRDLWW